MTTKILKNLIFALTMLVSSYAYSSIEINLEAAVAVSSIENDIADYSDFLNSNFENLNVSVAADADKEKVLEELELLEKIMNGDIAHHGIKLELVECTHPACIFSDTEMDTETALSTLLTL